MDALSLDPMPTTTPEAPPPTPEQMSNASALLAEADASLRDLPGSHPDRARWVNAKVAAYNVLLAAKDRPAASGGPTPSQILAGTDEAKALRARLTQMPEGDPLTPVLLARLQELTPLTNHAAFSAPAPGAFTEADVDRAAPSHWGDAEKVQYRAAWQRVGATPMEAVMLHHAIRDGAPAHDGRPLGDYLREIWGAHYEANLAHANRAYTKLERHEQDAIADYLRSPRLLKLLVQIGQRAGRR